VYKLTAYFLRACMQVRAAAKRASSQKYSDTVRQRTARKEHLASNPMPRNELEDLFVSKD